MHHTAPALADTTPALANTAPALAPVGTSGLEYVLSTPLRAVRGD